jgi:hypothetical protein
MEQELDKTTLHSRYVLRYNMKAPAKPHLPRHYEDEQEENWSPGWDELPEPGKDLPPRSPDTVPPPRSWGDYRRDEAASAKPRAPRIDSRHRHYPHELKVDNPQYEEFLDGPDVVHFDRQHPDNKDPWSEIPKHYDRYSPVHSPVHSPLHSPTHNAHRAGYPAISGVVAPRRESLFPEPSILPEEEELDTYDRKYWTTNFDQRHYSARDYEKKTVAGDDYSEDGEPAIPTIRHHPSVWSHQATLNMSPVMHRRTSLNLLHPERAYKNWRDLHTRQLARDDSSTYQRFKQRILNKFPGQKKATSLCDFKDFPDPPKKQKFLTNEDILDAIVRQMPRKKVFKKAKKKKRPKLASDSDLSTEPIGKYWRKDPLERVPSSLHHWHKVSGSSSRLVISSSSLNSDICIPRCDLAHYSTVYRICEVYPSYLFSVPCSIHSCNYIVVLFAQPSFSTHGNVCHIATNVYQCTLDVTSSLYPLPVVPGEGPAAGARGAREAVRGQVLPRFQAVPPHHPLAPRPHHRARRIWGRAR